MGVCVPGILKVEQLPVGDCRIWSKIRQNNASHQQNMVAKNYTAESNTFEQLNDELNDLYKFLKENNFSDEEIERIFEPLRGQVKYKEIFRYCFIATFFLTLFIIGCLYYDNISWYFLAVARVILIKVQPYWNWQTLMNRNCLIYQFSTRDSLPPEEFVFNCDVCETINAIDVHQSIDPNILKLRYTDLDTPVILSDSQFGWPQGSELVGNISSNRDFRFTHPCAMASNIASKETTVGKLLDKTELFDSFFMHFRNCEAVAVKKFRMYVGRPQYLHPGLAPIQSSWLLWSKDYNVSNYKQLDLVEQVAVVGQIEGSNYFKLTPRLNCEAVCDTLEVKLEKGEALVVTGLWNLSYRPHEKGDNVAVILETH